MRIEDAIERLRQRSPLPLFVSGVWDPELAEALRAAKPDELFHVPDGREVADSHMAVCAIAGLHLWNDDFEGSHGLCQAIHTPTGSYWHGLCHRREGHRGSGLASNLGNARYWFRQVGDHPAYDAVYRSALNVLDRAGTGFRWATEATGLLRARGSWDPYAMLDWFAQADAQTVSTQTQALLEEIQWREIVLLTDWCVEHALRG